MATYTFQKRTFLNPVSTNRTSYILAHVEDSKEGTDKYSGNLIIMADCDHKIELEFFLGTKQDRRRSIAKVNSLIDTFTGFRDALTKQIESIESK